VALGIRVPDYEVDRKLWVNEHYEGGYLFRDAIVLEMFPPEAPGEKWKVTSAWQGQDSKPLDQEIDAKAITQGKVAVRIGFESKTTPGVKGQLRFVVSAWNPDAVMEE
jgi:hypothetical protein